MQKAGKFINHKNFQAIGPVHEMGLFLWELFMLDECGSKNFQMDRSEVVPLFVEKQNIVA